MVLKGFKGACKKNRHCLRVQLPPFSLNFPESFACIPLPTAIPSADVKDRIEAHKELCQKWAEFPQTVRRPCPNVASHGGPFVAPDSGHPSLNQLHWGGPCNFGGGAIMEVAAWFGGHGKVPPFVEIEAGNISLTPLALF